MFDSLHHLIRAVRSACFCILWWTTAQQKQQGKTTVCLRGHVLMSQGSCTVLCKSGFSAKQGSSYLVWVCSLIRFLMNRCINRMWKPCQPVHPACECGHGCGSVEGESNMLLLWPGWVGVAGWRSLILTDVLFPFSLFPGIIYIYTHTL